MLETGTRIDGYKVVAHLATGGMGEIYRVVHEDRGTEHALKYLALPNNRVRKRLIREAELQTKLSHPNVVTLTEVIEIDGDPGLVMELVDGPSLARWLRDHRPSLEHAEGLFRGILAGVAHAHRNGMVHRDLKPSNVLLASSPEGMVPKIADFGIAKALEAEDQEKLTRTGHSLGSPAYMAPEQIQNARDVDQRADVFSLGCLLYELVCGERAFKGDDTLDVLNAVSMGHYIPPTQLVPDLPERITRTITACLARDPANRPPGCEVLLEMLEDADDPSDQRLPLRHPTDLSEEPTEPRVRPLETTRPLPPPAPPARQVALEGVAGAVLTVVVLLGALLIGVLGAWLILG